MTYMEATQSETDLIHILIPCLSINPMCESFVYLCVNDVRASSVRTEGHNQMQVPNDSIRCYVNGEMNL